MSVAAARQRADQALQKVAKWRTLLVGWQLGTRPADDAEAAAVRDQRELLILLRVEVSALAGVLLERGLVSEEQWLIALADEARALDEGFERRFPGASTSPLGITIDPKRAAAWMKGWRP